MKKLRGDLFSLLNLHIAGVAGLLILNLVLGIRFFLAWNTLRASSNEQLQQEQAAYRTLQIEMTPVRGLPQKVSLSSKQADEFYAARFPAAYSTISAAINELALKNSVRLTSLAYSPRPALEGLAELRMDASLSGEYASLMHFINGLERSKTFFLIEGLTLTGSQGGMVNLRLRLTTYLHASGLEQLAPANQNEEAPAGEENH
jgi:type IV pilus assembly protein PilO